MLVQVSKKRRGELFSAAVHLCFHACRLGLYMSTTTVNTTRTLSVAHLHHTQLAIHGSRHASLQNGDTGFFVLDE